MNGERGREGIEGPEKKIAKADADGRLYFLSRDTAERTCAHAP